MTNKMVKWVAAGVCAPIVLVGAFLAYVQLTGIPSYRHAAPARHVEVTPERAAAGKKLAMTLCIGCHLDGSTGRLTGKLMADLTSEFGVVYSANITRSKAAWHRRLVGR